MPSPNVAHIFTLPIAGYHKCCDHQLAWLATSVPHNAKPLLSVQHRLRSHLCLERGSPGRQQRLAGANENNDFHGSTDKKPNRCPPFPYVSTTQSRPRPPPQREVLNPIQSNPIPALTPTPTLVPLPGHNLWRRLVHTLHGAIPRSAMSHHRETEPTDKLNSLQHPAGTVDLVSLDGARPRSSHSHSEAIFLK